MGFHKMHKSDFVHFWKVGIREETGNGIVEPSENPTRFPNAKSDPQFSQSRPRKSLRVRKLRFVDAILLRMLCSLTFLNVSVILMSRGPWVWRSSGSSSSSSPTIYWVMSNVPYEKHCVYRKWLPRNSRRQPMILLTVPTTFQSIPSGINRPPLKSAPSG